MSDSFSDPVAVIASFQPLTVGNLMLALLGLPLIVVLLGVTNTDLNTIYTMGIHWALALIVLGIAVGGEGLSWSQLGFGDHHSSILDMSS